VGQQPLDLGLDLHRLERQVALVGGQRAKARFLFHGDTAADLIVAQQRQRLDRGGSPFTWLNARAVRIPCRAHPVMIREECFQLGGHIRMALQPFPAVGIGTGINGAQVGGDGLMVAFLLFG